MGSRSTVHGLRSTAYSHLNFLRTHAFCLKLFALSLLLSACSKTSDSKFSGHSIKFQQYYVQGEQLYVKHCSNCHQKNGKGLGLVYPPLDKSEYVDNNFESVICLMKYGIKGELTVNGKSFNKEMPGIPSLTDLEVVEIATYIYNSWDHKRDSINITDVSRILNACQQLEKQ